MKNHWVKSGFLKKLGFFILLAALLTAGVVFFFDPFFHYHKPWAGLKAVLNQEEYQVIGTIRHFDYDALLMGSSTAENYNSHWFDDSFDCTTIKAVKPGANTADLMYFLEEAYQVKELKYVFYSLDISALTSDRRENFVTEGMPLYLYNHNPFDDVQYLFNKHVLMEEIPYMIATSLMKDYDEGDAYNWAQYKDFSTMSYQPTTKQQTMKGMEEYGENVDYNVDLLEEMVKSHPETEFVIIIPPYSSLWWYEAAMQGETEGDFYAVREACSRLLTYENVSIHYFQNDEEIISNLDNYMDLIHFSQDINRYIVDSLLTEEHRLTAENVDNELGKMEELCTKCVEVYAKEYFEGSYK